MSENGQVSPDSGQNDHESLNAAMGEQNTANNMGQHRSRSVGNQLNLPLEPSQTFPVKVNGDTSPQRSPADTTFSGRNGNGSPSSKTSAASDHQADTQAKEDVRASGRRMGIALSNNESTPEA